MHYTLPDGIDNMHYYIFKYYVQLYICLYMMDGLGLFVELHGKRLVLSLLESSKSSSLFEFFSVIVCCSI